MWILVLRNTKTGKSHIWRGKDFKTIVRTFRSFIERSRAKNLGLWTEEAEDLLWKHYKTCSSSVLARELSKLTGRALSRNAVIGHYHRMKRSREAHHVLSRETAQSHDALEQSRRQDPAPMLLRQNSSPPTKPN